MATETIDISEARKNIAGLNELLEDEPVIWVTKRNKKVFAVVDKEWLEGVIETMEVMADTELLRELDRRLSDMKSGKAKLVSQEEVEREFL